MQVKLAIPSWQTPPFWHGPLAQSSMFVSQFVPLNPAGQAHEYVPAPFVQVPPF